MKRIVAREWLCLVGAVLVGFTILLVLTQWLGAPGGPYQEWLMLMLIPYLLLQFIRSIAWATIVTSAHATHSGHGG